YPDPASPDPGYQDGAYAEGGYQEAQYADASYADSQYTDQQYADQQYTGAQYADAQYSDAEYAGDPYADQQYADAPYGEQQYAEAAYEEPQRPAPRRRPAKSAKAKSAKSAKKAGRSGRASRPDPQRPERGPRPPGRGAGLVGPKLYFGAAAALAAIVLMAGAAVVLGGGDGSAAHPAPAAALGRPATSGPSPASYSSSPSSAAYAAISARTSDAAPLTIGEAFPESSATVSVPGGGVRLTLRAKRLDGDCNAAIWGATVAADLRRGGCTQAARGVYSDTGRGYGLAVAVFNLAGSADADRFVETLDRSRGGGFVRPLEGSAASASFGQGFGMARGLAQGHYAVVAWARRLDGKGDETDETLLSLLIEGGKAPSVLGRAAAAAD
ncbi:hypothetical protein, partial [Actinomadura rubrisoli]|uniref:hypothetical protein n=1 Tax=Actinomadura rubrisoli TaxID=2530368 RepID=UPI001404B4F3